MIRYPNATWMPTRRRTGHRFYRHANPLLVLHTRESPRLGGVYDWPPHLSVDLASGKAHQHVEFNRSAYALHGSEPNRRGGRPTFQVELVGYARDVPHYNDDWYAALADLIEWFHLHLAVPTVFPRPFTGSDAYGHHGTVRVGSTGLWEALSGVVGHQHAPDNRHWDPGALDVSRVEHFLHQTHHTPDIAPKPAPHHDLTSHNGGTVTLTLALPVLRHQVPNTKSQHVRNAQALLNAHGAALTVDGAFGPAMEKAVKTFQIGHALHDDGIIGGATWRAML